MVLLPIIININAQNTLAIRRHNRVDRRHLNVFDAYVFMTEAYCKTVTVTWLPVH